MDTLQPSSDKCFWDTLLGPSSPLFLPFCLLCIFISPFVGVFYALYAIAYAALFGWDAWGKKMDAQAEKRRGRFLQRGESHDV